MTKLLPQKRKKMIPLHRAPREGALPASVGSMERGNVPSSQGAPWCAPCSTLSIMAGGKLFFRPPRAPLRTYIATSVAHVSGRWLTPSRPRIANSLSPGKPRRFRAPATAPGAARPAAGRAAARGRQGCKKNACSPPCFQGGRAARVSGLDGKRVRALFARSPLVRTVLHS